MNILDWVLICAGAFCALRGFMRGAVSQVFGIAGILAGFLAASYKYHLVSAFLVRQFPSISAGAALPLSFVLLFLLTWFSIAVAGFWITRILRSTGLGFIDRLWGAMIGFGKALLFAIVAISILTLFSARGNSSLIAQSKLAPTIMGASRVLFDLAPANVQRELSRKQQSVKKAVSERTSALMDSFVGHGPGSKEKGGSNKN